MAPPRRRRPDEQGESNRGLLVALGIAGGVLALGLGWLALRPKPPAPSPPPPPSPQGSATRTFRQSESFYKGTLEEDARRYGLPSVELDEIALPLPHAVELDSPRPLAIGQALETAHLAIKLESNKHWAKADTAAGQGMRTDHLVLSITNRGAMPLAYRVDTVVSQPEECRGKIEIEHNAIALGAHETVARTECLVRRGESLAVTRVEVIELLPLEYFYVSRLLPEQIGLDARVSGGHAPPKETHGKLCQFIPGRDIQASGATWPDVIDFYARHNCDEYTIHNEYRFRTERGPLPALRERLPPAPPDGG